MINYSIIEKVHAAARRERSAYVHAQLKRFVLWVTGLFSSSVDSASAPAAEACC